MKNEDRTVKVMKIAKGVTLVVVYVGLMVTEVIVLGKVDNKTWTPVKKCLADIGVGLGYTAIWEAITIVPHKLLDGKVQKWTEKRKQKRELKEKESMQEYNGIKYKATVDKKGNIKEVFFDVPHAE